MEFSNGLRPAGYDKRGPYYKTTDLLTTVAEAINNQTYFSQRGKSMSKDIDSARAQLDTATSEFNAACQRFWALEARFSDNTKQVTGRIRDSSQRLTDGLARIEKSAALPTLERYCGLLERMATALQSLAELEQRGLLERVAKAIK